MFLDDKTVKMVAKRPVREDSRSMAQGDSVEPGSNNAAQSLVLVVEDNLRTRNLEKFVLQEEGYEVAEAGSGEEALEALAARNHALVLLDIGLPGMDGFVTCQRIREFSQVPVIMVTGEDKDDDKVRGLELGADDYVTKPFSTNELAARVKAVLRRFEWTAAPGRDATEPQAGGTIADAPIDTEYEGTVRLVVSTSGCIRRMIHFVDEIRQNSQFHLLRLVANQQSEGMDILLRLREPIRLKMALLEMEDVSHRFRVQFNIESIAVFFCRSVRQSRCANPFSSGQSNKTNRILRYDRSGFCF